MEEPVQKGERLWSGEGIAIYATDLADRLILEFEEEAVCEAAYRIQALLKKHALASSFVGRLDSRSFLIRHVSPLPLQLVAETAQVETQVAIEGTDGHPLSRDEALAVAGISPGRLEAMEDVATHVARSLRAHLSLRGAARLRLVLRFGLTHEGACLLQVVNPLGSDLGTTDMKRLAEMLGG